MTRKLLYALLPLLTVTMLTACVNDDSTSGCDTDGKKAVQVTFTIVSSGNATRTTRAMDTWGDNEDAGNPHGTLYETQIDPGKLQVFVYGTDNKYVGTVDLTSYSPVREGTGEGVRWKYTFTGTLLLDESGTNAVLNNNFLTAKLVLLANCPTFTPKAGGTLADMKSETFDYNNGSGFGADGKEPSTLIPMWGVKTLSNVELTPDFSTDIGEIWMLRTMAKVRLTVSEESKEKGFKIMSASLNRYNNKGYIVPNGYLNVEKTEAIYMENETDADKPSSFNPYNDIKTESVSFSEDPTENDGGYYIYVPEYDNSADDAVITVTVGKVNGKSYDFKLEKYDESSQPPVSLVRNHIYHYELTVADEVKVKLKYQVVDWTTSDNEVVFW